MQDAVQEGVIPCAHDYEITITDTDGKEDYINPRAFVFNYKKANIKIIVPASTKYSMGDFYTQPEIPLAYLLSTNEADHPEILEVVRFITHGYKQHCDLLMDYLLGDRLVCDSPRLPSPLAPPRKWRRTLFQRLASAAGAGTAGTAGAGAAGTEEPEFTPLVIDVPPSSTLIDTHNST
jgi:hypothetical protein